MRRRARPRINRHFVEDFSRRYDESGLNDTSEEENIKARLAGEKYLTKGDFLDICLWKNRRGEHLYRSNPPDLVEEVSRIALGARHEKLRIESLMILNGVGYPVASALLHFAYPDSYPILDFRVLESLGIQQPSQYTFEFWWGFVQRMRRESRRLGVEIRKLDKALWMYSRTGA